MVFSISLESFDLHFHFPPHFLLRHLRRHFHFPSHYLLAHIDLKLDIVIGVVKQKLKKVLYKEIIGTD